MAKTNFLDRATLYYDDVSYILYFNYYIPKEKHNHMEYCIFVFSSQHSVFIYQLFIIFVTCSELKILMIKGLRESQTIC